MRADEPDGRTGRHEGMTVHLLAGALMLGGPVWHVLYTNHYPFSRPEAFALPLIAGAIGAVLAAVAGRSGALLGAVLYGGLLFAFADLQLDPQQWTYLAAIPPLCIALAWMLRRHRATITALALGAFYVSSIVRPPLVPPAALGGPAQGRVTRPLIVHVYLDEQWGVGGIRAEGNEAWADELRDFYASRGFEVFEGAYSRYAATGESISHELALGDVPSFRPPAASRGYWQSLKRIPYFESLRDSGYVLRVYQTTYLDYCRADGLRIQACFLESGNSIRNVGLIEGSALTRGLWSARFILNTQSRVYRRLRDDPEQWRRFVAGAGVVTLRRLADDIASGPVGGTAYFAHVLLPHRPVDMDGECHVLADGEERIHDEVELERRSIPMARALELVRGQSRCAHRMLDSVIAAVDRVAGRDGAIVVVQGDHGSRLLPKPPADPELKGLTASELARNYATLFAVRRPRVAGGLHTGGAPVQDLLRHLVAHNFEGALPDTGWTHYLRRERSRKSPSDTLRILHPADMRWVPTAY